MGRLAKSTQQIAYVRGVSTSAWQSFRAEALRRGLTKAEALEIMIAVWLKVETTDENMAVEH